MQNHHKLSGRFNPGARMKRGWRGTICQPPLHPHPAWPPGQDRAQNPHTPFSPSESPWQQEQSSLVLKVSRLSSLLTANQLQEYRKRNEDCSLVDSLTPDEFWPQEEASSHLHWHLQLFLSEVVSWWSGDVNVLRTMYWVKGLDLGWALGQTRKTSQLSGYFIFFLLR